LSNLFAISAGVFAAVVICSVLSNCLRLSEARAFDFSKVLQGISVRKG
jgi:hypothetical protein